MPIPQNPKAKLFYLASPYSHENRIVMDYRYFLVAAAAAELYNRGFNLLEPIGSGHPIATKYDLPKGYEYWQQRDRLMIERSDGVIVLTIPGWAQSKGVTDEIQYCKTLGKPVFYVNPAELLPSEVIADGPYSRAVSAVKQFQNVALPVQTEKEPTGAEDAVSRFLAAKYAGQAPGAAPLAKETVPQAAPTPINSLYQSFNPAAVVFDEATGESKVAYRFFDPTLGEEVIRYKEA